MKKQMHVGPDIQDSVIIAYSALWDESHFHRVSLHFRLANGLLLLAPNSYLAPAFGFGKGLLVVDTTGVAGALGFYRSP
jgi:hypothetical protein